MAADHHTFMGKEFTLRLLQVISLKSIGLKDRQVAAYLGISENTVKAYMKTIRLLLGKGTFDMQTTARANGFTPDGHYGTVNLFADRTDMPWHKDSKNASPSADEADAPEA